MSDTHQARALLIMAHGSRSETANDEFRRLVERVAQIYTYASLLGKANPLPDEAIRSEVAIFQMQHAIQGDLNNAGIFPNVYGQLAHAGC